MKRENLFNPDTVRYLADRESGSGISFSPANNQSLKHLDPLFFTLFNAGMDLYCIAGLEIRDIHPHLFSFQILNNVHSSSSALSVNPAGQPVNDNGRGRSH